MCGEKFSSKFTAEEKASAAAPAPFALRDRWTVGYKSSYSNSIEPAWWVTSDDFEGYASKEAAEASIIEHNGSDRNLSRSGPALGKFFAVPPQVESGDHDVERAHRVEGSVTTDDLIDFAAAILNNREAEFERLRVKLAGATLFAPTPKKTKAEAAEALYAFLTDDTTDSGNYGDFIDVDGEDAEFNLRNAGEGIHNGDDVATLRLLLREYRDAVA